MKAPLCAILLFGSAARLMGQSPTPAPVSESTPVTVTTMLRERTDVTQWFGARPPAEEYANQNSLLRIGVVQRIRHFDYELELGQSAEIGLPTDAVSPNAAQGQLGLGGTYYAANNSNPDPAAASFRQGFLRYHFHNENDAVRLGRFEFFEGQEMTPENNALLWLQNNRIAQRLVGNFGFSNGQRSFDGIDGKLEGRDWDITAMAGRATQGVFNMNANPELNVDIEYIAYTRGVAHQRILLRAFGLGYHDGRTGIVKTDNRSLAVRSLDHQNIRIGTYGGDAIAAIPVRSSTVDLLVWGAGQNGSWGMLGQRSGAFAVEGGVRLDSNRTQPWLRGGILRSTGDGNPEDGTHGTFFQVLPTPRLYARFPFFNLMNSTDHFVQVVDRPASKLELRSDLRWIQLTSSKDLWYQGGGAFDNKVFGYVGRPSNNHASFATLYDISADYGFRQFALNLYFAHAFGKSVVASIYPAERGANYGFVELDYRLQHKLGVAPKP